MVKGVIEKISYGGSGRHGRILLPEFRFNLYKFYTLFVCYNFFCTLNSTVPYISITLYLGKVQYVHIPKADHTYPNFFFPTDKLGAEKNHTPTMVAETHGAPRDVGRAPNY